MESENIRKRLRAEMGLEVGPEVAAYVAARLTGGASGAALPLLAQDARTGLAVRRELSFEELSALTPREGAWIV
jgi:hypothetical protein